MGNRYGVGNPAYDGLNRLTRFNGAAIQHDLLGNRLQDGRYLYQWDALNRLVQMQAYQASGRFKVVGDAWRFVYRADGLRVVREKVSQAAGADGGGEGGGSSRTEYLYDGQMPVCEQEFAGSTLRTTRVNFLGARGIEAVVAIDHTRGNQVALRWLLYDGHGNLVRTMAPDYRLSAFQWRGVWGEVQSSLGTGRGYCANLGHPEDETGLVYMRARYYEPATGRFISEDPARDGVNWYLYADGNPVNKVDPDGRAVQGALAALLVAFSFAFGVFVGIGVGYMVGVSIIRQDDPKYKASPNWLVDFCISLAVFAGEYATHPKGAIWGSGIRFSRLIARMGLVGAIGFIIGFEIGMLMAALDYLQFQELREAYEN
jgi:RHS repeat-associated protein